MSQLLYLPQTVLGFLGSAILIIITAGLFFQSRAFIHRLSLLTLAISFIWILTIYPIETAAVGEHFIWNGLSKSLSLTLIGIGYLVLIYTKGLLSDTPINNDYYSLCLLSLFGGLVMLTAGNVVVFYLGLELLALPLYGLAALNLRDKLQIEATVKYIVMGIVTSTLLLYGFCLLYATHTHFSLKPSIASNQLRLLSEVGTALLMPAFLFKLGAIPFHFWVPDIYQHTSLASNVFISTVPKMAAIGMGLRLVLSPLVQLSPRLQYLLLGLGLLSIIGGNLVALKQTDLRRLIAYSSVAHMGPILLGLALSPFDYSIIVFYGMSYCFMVTTLFGVITYLAKLGMPINSIDDLQGLNRRYPTAALLILVIMISMAGIPLSIGFFSKFGLLYSLIQQKFYGVGSIALLGTTLATYYYLSIIKYMYFNEASPLEPAKLTHVTQNDRIHQLTLVLSGIILMGLGIFPGVIIDKLSIIC